MGKNLLDILLDDDNTDPVFLTDEKGREIAFEQIAIIPYSQRIYCILKPIDKMPGVEEDEGLVFYVDEFNDEVALKLETDEVTMLKIFEEYYKLLEESEGGDWE